MVAGITPEYLAGFPGDVHGVGNHSPDIAEGLRSQIADARMDANTPLGSNDKKPVKAYGAGNKAPRRHANAAPERSSVRGSTCSFGLPVKCFHPIIQCLLNKGAGRGMEAAIRFGRADRRLASGSMTKGRG